MDIVNDLAHKAANAADSFSSATQQAVDEGQFGDSKAFGSPHVSSPAPPEPRSPLEAAAKQLDFGAPKTAAPASPSTPIMPNKLVGEISYGDEVVDYDAFIRDTLLWSNKVRSVVYLLGGLLLIYLTHRLLTSSVSIVTAICWALLSQSALNFLRAFISPQFQERCTWHDSAWTHGFVSRVSNSITGAAVLHDKHLNGKEPSKMLRIVASLWVISLVGRAMGATTLASLLWITAFVLPKAYTMQQAKIDATITDVTSQIKGHFLKLDPRARAALVVVPIFVAGYALSSADLAVAILILALYGRSCMAPSQVERLNAVVAPPITNTIGKVSNTVGRVMASAATKYELTPTPQKKKRS